MESASKETQESIPEKLFYSIGEVAAIAGVKPHVLRYWESEFPMFQPQKNEAGQRIYRRKEIDTILKIKELLYKEGYTIAGACKILRQGIHPDESKNSLIRSLKRDLDFLLKFLDE